MRIFATAVMSLSLVVPSAAFAQGAGGPYDPAPRAGSNPKTDQTMPTTAGPAPVAPGSLGTSRESTTGGNSGGTTDRN